MRSPNLFLLDREEKGRNLLRFSLPIRVPLSRKLPKHSSFTCCSDEAQVAMKFWPMPYFSYNLKKCVELLVEGDKASFTSLDFSQGGHRPKRTCPTTVLPIFPVRAHLKTFTTPMKWYQLMEFLAVSSTIGGKSWRNSLVLKIWQQIVGWIKYPGRKIRAPKVTFILLEQGKGYYYPRCVIHHFRLNRSILWCWTPEGKQICAQSASFGVPRWH